jgi:nucleoid DNA-binding protein
VATPCCSTELVMLFIRHHQHSRKRTQIHFERAGRARKGGGGKSGGFANWIFCVSKKTWVTRVTGFWHKPRLTKRPRPNSKSALAKPPRPIKETAGVSLDILSTLAYKEIKKTGVCVLPGFGKLVKQKRKARTGFNPKTQEKIKDSSQDRRQISGCQGRKGCGFGGKEVVKELRPGKP